MASNNYHFLIRLSHVTLNWIPGERCIARKIKFNRQTATVKYDLITKHIFSVVCEKGCISSVNTFSGLSPLFPSAHTHTDESNWQPFLMGGAVT